MPSPNQPSSTSFVPERTTTYTLNRHHLNALLIQRFRVGVSVVYVTIVRKKNTIGHKCKSPPQLLLLTDDSEVQPDLQEPFISEDLLAEELQVLEVQEHSYHALAGGHSSSTLRFLRHINGSPVQVLLDGGSDHNFVQTRATNFLQLPVDSTPNFSVMVSSGQ